MNFLVVDDSELLKFLDMKAGELLPEEVPRLKIPAEERLQIKASGDGESPLVVFKKTEFTGTKRMQDPVTRELLSYMDSSSFEADVDESRFCRRIMSSERKVVFLNLHGVKLKIDEFGAQLEVAGESAYHADRGNLFSVHSFGEGAFKNWHKILGLPIFAREANGGRSKTFASFLAGDWHGPLGASIGDLHLGHFCSNPLYGGSFSYAAKASMGVAIENVGHIFSLVSGIDYTPIFDLLRREADGPQVMGSDDWDVGYLRQRIEMCISTIFWLLKKSSLEAIRGFYPDASTIRAEDTFELVYQVVQKIPALNMLTSNMKKLQCERWKTGPKVLGGTHQSSRRRLSPPRLEERVREDRRYPHREWLARLRLALLKGILTRKEGVFVPHIFNRS